MDGNFTKIVALLEQLKRVWYLCQYHSEIVSDGNTATVKAAQNIMTEKLAGIRFPAVTDVAVSLQCLSINLCCEVCPDGHTISSILGQIQKQADETDTPFYVTARLGKYWNELPLPACIESFFVRYVDSIKSKIDGLIGVEQAGMQLKDDMFAISYYDLSDTAIVFENEAAAKKFANKNPVDPTDFMRYNNGAWFGM